jgi:hypothetical protein
VSPLAERIAHAVYQNSPNSYCFACLAAQQGVKEHDVRAVALVLLVRAGLRLVPRVCSGCQCPSDALVAQKSA